MTSGEVFPEMVSEADVGLPAKRNWPVFFILLLLTLFTTFLAGGATYAVSLFAILGAHEFGHYWASRRNQVMASLPYFLPAPPSWFLFGTFGAMIMIRDRIPNRRVLMEIGASGPIAGFLVAVPMLVVGLFLSSVTAVTGEHGLVFGSSLILVLLGKLILGVTPWDPDINIQLHPLAFSAWVGLFVTSLNLIPIGQLDGGHIIYSMLGEKYKICARVFFAFLVLLVFFWPGWLLWVLLLGLLTRLKSAEVVNPDILPGGNHRILGILCIIIFLLTFVPIPIELV